MNAPTTYLQYRQQRLDDPDAKFIGVPESWPIRFENEQAIGAVPR